MKTGWSLTDNPFETATVGNYKRMLKIGNYTHGALHGNISDPFFLNLYNNFHPVRELYLSAYTQWMNTRGTKTGGTLNVSQLLRKLSFPTIGRWSGQIQSFYMKRTPRYEELLPRGTVPFHNGSRASRIAAVQTLSKAIGSDANLAMLKAEVDAFAALLSGGRSTQQGSIGETKLLSAKVEPQRKALATALMIVYAQLVLHYPSDLERIEPFFDLENVRHKRQKVFTRHLKPGQSKTIVKRTLQPDDKLEVKNTGTVPLTICIASAKGMVCENGVTVQPNSEAKVEARQLGDVPNMKFITITNAGEEEGSCVISLM